jgi:hypothetical protein
MIPTELAAKIAESVRKSKKEREDPSKLKDSARRASIRKLMSAMKSDDEDQVLTALDELSDINQD